MQQKMQPDSTKLRDEATASDTRGPGSNPVIGNFYRIIIFCKLFLEKTKIKKNWNGEFKQLEGSIVAVLLNAFVNKLRQIELSKFSPITNNKEIDRNGCDRITICF